MVKILGISGLVIGPLRMYPSVGLVVHVTKLIYRSTTIEKDRLGQEHLRMNFNVSEQSIPLIELL